MGNWEWIITPSPWARFSNFTRQKPPCLSYNWHSPSRGGKVIFSACRLVLCLGSSVDAKDGDDILFLFTHPSCFMSNPLMSVSLIFQRWEEELSLTRPVVSQQEGITTCASSTCSCSQCPSHGRFSKILIKLYCIIGSANLYHSKCDLSLILLPLYWHKSQIKTFYMGLNYWSPGIKNTSPSSVLCQCTFNGMQPGVSPDVK